MVYGAVTAMFLVGCGGKPAINDSFNDLAGADEKSDVFSKRMKLLGSLDYGQSATADYHNPPRYRAYKFGGKKGDAVTIDVQSEDGDAVAWLVDNSFKVVASNDDFGDSTNSHIEAKLPGNTNPDVITYYIIFREYSLEDASFSVSLTGPAADDFFACNVDHDCIATTVGGCCPNCSNVAVNRGQVDAYYAANKCATPRICPLACILDTRIAVCNKTQHQCEMVQPTTCGGIAARPCTQSGYSCVDNPWDSCDPAHGGADCGGICVPTCIQNVLCAITSHYDRIKCTCVPN
jgi:hypothetical protein